MRLSSLFVILLTFAAGAMMSLVAANFSVTLIEESSEISVREVLDDGGLNWAEVQADGLRVALSGVAPTEALRFRALSAAGTVVDAARVIDEMQVEAQAVLAPPRFSAEILRNDAGLSVIGLIPTSTDREAVITRFKEIEGEKPVTDLLETADYPVPDGWEEAMLFALDAMKDLKRAKVSIAAGDVSITAITDSPEARLELEQSLIRRVTPGINVSMDIAAPRPVATPFTLRFKIDKDGARFDGCTADTDKAQAAILEAAKRAGASDAQRCTVALGVPSPRWSEAATKSIDALATLGGGAVTLVDADVTLIAAPGTSQSDFDRVIGELETALPDVFALSARLPKASDPRQGPAEFVATLSPEGQVQLRGRIASEALRSLSDSYAKSRFGVENVYTATRIVDDLPDDWSTRVLAGIEGLSHLSNGYVNVTADRVKIAGNTGSKEASDKITTLLAGKLGDGADFDVEVKYQKKLDPVASLPTPDECIEMIGKVLAIRKISFEPGSATIDAATLGTMDGIADILKRCGKLPLEIQGHTDSQGRTEMNLALSQSRAESVLNELRARRVRTSTFVAKGYGEETPIADNKTEAGREVNRRIEFKLIRPDTVSQPDETTLEAVAENGDTSQNPAANEKETEEGTPDEQN